MAYTPTYVADDMDDIVSDGIGTFGVALIGFASLIVVVGVVLWLSKSWNFAKLHGAVR